MDRDDVLEIHQLLALYGHVADGDLSRLGEVFADDAIFDGVATGGKVHIGIPQIRVFFDRVNPPHPPSHHTTNVFVWSDGNKTQAISKWMTIDPLTGRYRSGDYMDLLILTPQGWRISSRTVVCRWWGGPPTHVFQN